MSTLAIMLLQVPTAQVPDLTFMERVQQLWTNGGWVMWPLGACALLGLGIIVWKLIDLSTAAGRTRSLLTEADEFIADGRLSEALNVSRDSDAPVGRVLAAGLERRDEGTERVMKAIENVGLLEMSRLERGLVWLATVSNVAPLLGFFGTVIGMIAAFNSIQLAGEVDASLVAGGIKIALITTATGLAIAIPVNIAHNYFVTRVDRLVIDMEESAQKMIDAIHDTEASASIAG